MSAAGNGVGAKEALVVMRRMPDDRRLSEPERLGEVRREGDGGGGQRYAGGTTASDPSVRSDGGAAHRLGDPPGPDHQVLRARG